MQLMSYLSGSNGAVTKAVHVLVPLFRHSVLVTFSHCKSITDSETHVFFFVLFFLFGRSTLDCNQLFFLERLGFVAAT